MARNERRTRRNVGARVEPLGSEAERRLAGRIRDLEAANRTLRESKERAEGASRAKSELLSRASHDLMNHVNTVLGFGQLMETSSLSPYDRECVDQILMGGRCLVELIEDLRAQSSVPKDRTQQTTRSNLPQQGEPMGGSVGPGYPSH